MKCNICKGRISKHIVNMEYEVINKTYKVLKVPVWICSKCNNTIIDDFVANNIKRYASLIKGDCIDYEKMKDDDDAAAASTIVMF